MVALYSTVLNGLQTRFGRVRLWHGLQQRGQFSLWRKAGDGLDSCLLIDSLGAADVLVHRIIDYGNSNEDLRSVWVFETECGFSAEVGF